MLSAAASAHGARAAKAARCVPGGKRTVAVMLKKPETVICTERVDSVRFADRSSRANEDPFCESDRNVACADTNPRLCCRLFSRESGNEGGGGGSGDASG